METPDNAEREYFEKVEKALLAAIPVVQYAVANLPPEVNVKWPYEALQEFCKILKSMPGDADTDFLNELTLFASECEGHETRRRLNPVKVVRATAADFGPQTDEAIAAHKTKLPPG